MPERIKKGQKLNRKPVQEKVRAHCRQQRNHSGQQKEKAFVGQRTCNAVNKQNKDKDPEI